MMFLEDDLDAILGELYELEKQLSTDEGSKNLMMGLPVLPVSSSHSSQLHVSAKVRTDVRKLLFYFLSYVNFFAVKPFPCTPAIR